MLYRSLVKALNLDGRSVTKNVDQMEKILIIKKVISKKKTLHLVIYIFLNQKSNKEEINSIENLYKIGFSSVEIEERIKNVENEPTFLMAPVTPITYFECYNLNPQKLEKLLHRFFGDSQLSLDVYDNDGVRAQP